MISVDAVIAAAREAGEAIQRVRADAFDVEQKRDSAGPVTEADRQADALLKDRLLDLDPCAWLSEETADSRARLAAPRLWVVDPLDGTKEFIEGVPQYTVAIALVDDGRPVLGVVHNPATGETFWAERGKGAYFGKGEAGRAEPIGVQGARGKGQREEGSGKRITVAEGATVLASRSEIRRGEFEPFEHDWDLRPIGSIQYKLALVAAGEAAVTWSRGPKHEWDVCAGALIVEEAGGIATDLFGHPLVFNQPFPKTKGVLAGAPETYARALKALRRTGASDRMKEVQKAEGRRPKGEA